MPESLINILEKLKSLGLEQLCGHAPWFFLTLWLLTSGVPRLVDQVSTNYEKMKVEIIHSLDRLTDSVERNTEEQRALRRDTSLLIQRVESRAD